MVKCVARALLIAGGLLTAASALAQQAPAGVDSASAEQQQRVGANYWKGKGDSTHPVVVKIGDVELYADEIELYSDKNRAVATGNFVLVQGTARITADRADFNIKTKLGTFYNAFGYATVKPQPARPAVPGALTVPVSTQDTDVYFTGEMIEKIAARKYRITKGGFTTCVQPTPRWELASNSILLNLDHYTLLRDAVFSVKGVPMLYTPIMYYPTKKDDRATGFLIPTYGQSTLRGHSLHNAFFWAIDRSEDLTIKHDWYSKTGQGIGSEYRYNFGGLTSGNFAAHILNEHSTTYANPDGSTTTSPDSQSFEIRGGATQGLPYGLRARVNVNYFSSLVTMQTLNTNIYDASRNIRNYGGNVVGAWHTYTLNATVDHNEYFSDANNSRLTGNWPRISLARSERPISGTPLYASVNGEYAGLLNETRNNLAPETNVDLGVNRFDFMPQIRFPFKRWQWFTVNTTLAWRDTYYTRSYTSASDLTPIDTPLNRTYLAATAQMTGPVFTRVWDTPNNGYAEKFKHTIEPFVNITRTSSIDIADRILKTDGVDGIYGGVQYTYGVANRFYAKRPTGRTSIAREIVTVQLFQTYYTDQRQAQYDPRYTTSSGGAQQSNFSTLSLRVQAAPTNDLNMSYTTEFDPRYLSPRNLSVSATYNWSGRLQTTGGWSKKNFIPQVPGFNDPNLLDQALNSTVNFHARDNRVGALYYFNYDVLHGSMLQQRISTFYNSQCCGVALEYQTFNYGGVTSGVGVTADHRFFLSFTLAGLGNFSPFNGALSGVPR